MIHACLELTDTSESLYNLKSFIAESSDIDLTALSVFAVLIGMYCYSTKNLTHCMRQFVL